MDTGTFWILVACGLVLWWALRKGFSTRCPSCHRLFALLYVSRKETNRKRGLATVNRTDTYSSDYGSGTINRSEQAVVVRVTYLYQYRCKFCNQPAHRTIVEQFEPSFVELEQPYEDDRYIPDYSDID
jgi:ribosomal protein L44E